MRGRSASAKEYARRTAYSYIPSMILDLDTRSLQRPLDDRSQVRIRLEAEAVLSVIDLVEYIEG